MASERNIAGTIKLLVNVRGLQLEYVRLLNEALHVPVLWRKKERSRNRAV